jgi:hypothetical protein
VLKLLDLLFGCHHQNTGQPFTPRGCWPRRTYVVCLDCGARINYNLETMRAGDVLPERAQQPDLVELARRREAH